MAGLRDGIFSTLFWIGTGGAIGSLLRYSADVIWIHLFPAEPGISSTLFVNLLGCLAMGFLFAKLSPTPGADPLKRFLLTGLLGSFTTYSGFGAEAIMLLDQSPVLFFLYLSGSVTGGVLALFTGMKLEAFLLRKRK